MDIFSKKISRENYATFLEKPLSNLAIRFYSQSIDYSNFTQEDLPATSSKPSWLLELIQESIRSHYPQENLELIQAKDSYYH